MQTPKTRYGRIDANRVFVLLLERRILYEFMCVYIYLSILTIIVKVSLSEYTRHRLYEYCVTQIGLKNSHTSLCLFVYGYIFRNLFLYPVYYDYCLRLLN